ncbi:MAG: hypothetical protein Q8S11_04165 [Daejeonella sp.]|uniref:hypothetical protein n=1 Tax=Daejeonella sp. TaxID=2805397 RepID=UPI002734B65D|nr:hypothetical protein [Daejeonella sp.]MDP3467500.1 hypothetical protein [Daejeonella sp.]
MQNRFQHILVIILIISFASCKGLQKDTIIYKNDFEGGNLSGIIDGKIEDYNGSKVIGRYSQNGFLLKLDSLPKHNMVQISFDLYIHDTWDGNAAKPEGPDIWIMNIDGWSAIYSTFANGLCTNCSQAFPVLQPSHVNGGFVFFNNKPNSNAIKTDLPGACILKDTKGGTSMYKILYTFEHTQSTLDIGCYAQLEDPDPANKNCNESWSVDNMMVKTIEFR